MYESITSYPGYRVIDEAARAVEELVAELEPSLEHDKRRLLHRLRLAAESLGMLRATAEALNGLPSPGNAELSRLYDAR